MNVSTGSGITEGAGDLLAPCSRCRDCGAEIAWVTTAKRKTLPLDLEPSDNPFEGNSSIRDGVAVYVRDAERMRHFDRHGNRLPGSGPVYVAHFATCAAR